MQRRPDEFKPGNGISAVAWMFTILSMIICGCAVASNITVAAQPPLYSPDTTYVFNLGKVQIQTLWFDAGLAIFLFSGLLHAAALIVKAIYASRDATEAQTPQD